MASTETADCGSKVIQLLDQQHLLYQQLNELARKQTDMVAGGDSEMLLRILAGRQRLIDRITQIDRELEPYRAEWARISESMAPAERQKAQELVADVQKLLGEILDRDKRDTEMLSGQKQQVSSQIQSASVGRRMNKAYGHATSGGGQSSIFDTNKSV